MTKKLVKRPPPLGIKECRGPLVPACGTAPPSDPSARAQAVRRTAAHLAAPPAPGPAAAHSK